MSTETSTALTVRQWIIRDLTDPQEIQDALDYQANKSLFRNRVEGMAVGTVIAVLDVPHTKVRQRIYQLNVRDGGGHWTVIPATNSFPHARVRRDS